jgi:hypothetical protein
MPAMPAPCIAVIGPASSGKTSLLHLLDEALQQHEGAPLAYVVKGNPDGGARYIYRAPRLRNSQKGQWTSVTLDRVVDWVRSAREHLEIVLVDVGGSREPSAQEGNRRLFKECSHYLVLAKTFDDAAEGREKGRDAWIKDAEESALELFAKVQSEIRLGDPFFEPDTKTGLFRGDAANPRDTLNSPLVDGLTESLLNLRVQRGAPQYFDLRRRPFWSELDLPGLNGHCDSLRAKVRESGDVFLGGAAPVFAYAAAFHHAIGERHDASVRIFDPKVPGGEVLIPRVDSHDPRKQFPSGVLRLDWADGRVLTLKLACATADKFLGPEVLDGLPSLVVPSPPRSLAGADVEIDGSGPIWLHLALSSWLRSQGAARIGHWDASLERVVWVWPLGPPQVKAQ